MAALHHWLLPLLVSSLHREEEQAVLFQDRQEDQANFFQDGQEDQAVLFQDGQEATAMPENKERLYPFDLETRRVAPMRRSVPNSQLAWQALKIPRCHELGTF